MAGLAQGNEAVGLDSLAEMPEARLVRIRPVVNSDFRISLEQGFVFAQLKGQENRVKLFSATRENLLVFNLFDRRHTIGEIADCAAHTLGWEPARSLAFTRDFFLQLVNVAICVPDNLPDEDDSPVSPPTP